jgi:hypothetical protein
MSWVGNTILTASVLPHPNSERLAVFPVGGGTGGAILVELVGTSGSGAGSLVSITSPLEGGAVKITGSVWVLNPSTGSGGGGMVEISGILPQYQGGIGYLPISGVVTLSGTSGALQVTGTVGLDGPVVISGTLSATILNLPATQSVSVQTWPFAGEDLGSAPASAAFVAGVSGTTLVGLHVNSDGDLQTTASISNFPAGFNVNISSSVPLTMSVQGTASVKVQNFPLTQDVLVTNWPVPVTGVDVLNLPATQSVSVQNFPVVQQVTGTVEVAGLTFSGTVSIPVEAYPNALENVQFTRKKQLFDFDSDTINYIGYAVIGASPAATAWAIKRLTFNVSGNLEASEWSSTTASWSNRVSEAYA